MANEFIARKGLIAKASSEITGSLNITGSLTTIGFTSEDITTLKNDTTITGSNSLSGNYALKVTNTSGDNILNIENDGNVGLGLADPSYKLQVRGDTDDSTDYPFRVENSSGTPLFRVRSDGYVMFGNLGENLAIDFTGGNRYLKFFNSSISAQGSTGITATGTINLDPGTGTSNKITFINSADSYGSVHLAQGTAANTTFPNSRGTEILFNREVNHQKHYGVIRGDDNQYQPVPVYIFSGKHTTNHTFQPLVLQYYPGAQDGTGSRGNVGIGTEDPQALLHVEGSISSSGTLSIPGFSDVSASLAAAVAGGDNLGNHTATQNLDMGTYAITNVGNVDGVDVSTLKSDFDTLEGKTLVSGSSQITHDSTTGFVANEHIDHSTVSITAGNGLTGGGTITSTRTLNVGAGDGISVGADHVSVDDTVLRTTGDGIISSSAQIDHDQTTNFNANEHFTQANITTVGTVTSGDVSAILPAGTVSGSAQTVANLDGQNVTVSSLTVENASTGFLLKDNTGTSTYVNFSPQGGLYINPGGIGNSISASSDITTHGDFIGESTHIKLIGPDGGGGSFTYLSSSGDPAAGSFKLSLGDIDGVGNTTTIIINDSTEQISLSKALSVTGNITVTGTVDGVDIASLENSVQANDTEIASLTAATSSYLTSVPAGTISSSAQVDHDTTTNFSADEHFTQANITTVGTIGTGVWQGTAIADGYISSATTWNNKLDSAGTIATNDYAKFDASGDLTGRSYSEVKTDLSLNNVTNESKATMFTSPTFTGTVAIPGFADVSASLAAAGGGSDFPYTGSAIVSGSLEVIGKVTGSVLIEGSGSTLFEVVGSEGQLFSITDSLSGSLFAVSDVSGLPILEVFSDDTVKIGSFNNEAITVSGSHTTIGGTLAIPGFSDVSASLAARATDISNLERLSKGRITFLYTGSVTYAPPGYIAFLDQVTDNIIINTSSYNGVDLDASVSNDYSKFQFNEPGSLITVRKVSDGSFKTYKIITATTNYTGNADNVGYLVDGGSFITVMESGSISDGDEVEFIWDKSAGVGGAYGPTAGTLTKTFAGLYQGGYNYLDMFFGTATDTEFDGDPENLSGVTVSSSFTDSSYFLPAISQSATLTLGGLTVNGTITGTINTSSITDFPTEVSRSAASAGFGSGGGGSSTPYSLGTFGGRYNWSSVESNARIAHGYVNGPTAGASQNDDNFGPYLDTDTIDTTTETFNTYKVQYYGLYSPVAGVPHIKAWGRSSDTDFATNGCKMGISIWSFTEPANGAGSSTTATLRASSPMITVPNSTILYLGNGMEASGSQSLPAGTLYVVTMDLSGSLAATANLYMNFHMWIE